MVYLHGYLAERSNPWAISIGHLVKRVETFTLTGDQSNHVGEAHCSTLHFWFSYIWSPKVTRRANLPKKHPDKIHISLLEFVVALIQFCSEGGFPIWLPCRTNPSVLHRQYVHQMLGKKSVVILVLRPRPPRFACGFASAYCMWFYQRVARR
jgi:hypothetical protein